MIGGSGDSLADDRAFFEAYEALLRRWPPDVRALDVPSAYGSTRVHVCGPEDGTPLVLLPGGGATSMAWYANVAELARAHRVYAPDIIGDFGRSVHDGAPLRAAADLVAWLDAVHDALGLEGIRLCGHSYGAWIALNYALHAPGRVAKLALLDPTSCFTGMSPRYLLHGLPQLLRPTPEGVSGFVQWETGAPPEDPAWRAFLESSATAHRSKVLAMRRPKPEQLRACTVPALVVLAGRSRAHSVRRAAAGAQMLPRATVTVLPDASHHSLPAEHPDRLNRLLAEFLA